MEQGLYLIISFIIESQNFSFLIHHESESDRLHAAGRKLRLYLSPQNRRKFKTYKSVQYAACLLGVHKVHVDVARIFNRVEDSVLGDLVENDTLGVLLLKVKGFEKVPRYSFSLAVFIGCEPHCVHFLCCFFQVCNHLLLVRRYNIFRSEPILHINAQFALVEVSYMSET